MRIHFFASEVKWTIAFANMKSTTCLMFGKGEGYQEVKNCSLAIISWLAATVPDFPCINACRNGISIEYAGETLNLGGS